MFSCKVQHLAELQSNLDGAQDALATANTQLQDVSAQVKAKEAYVKQLGMTALQRRLKAADKHVQQCSHQQHIAAAALQVGVLDRLNFACLQPFQRL
jgi:hypothetical protein